MEVEAMFPHEAQEMMAKILFLVFAALILCFSRIHATELSEAVPTTALTHKYSYSHS